MRTISPLIAVAAVLLLPAAGSSAASSCGAINGGFENTIRATGVSCIEARGVARKWHRKAVTQGQGPGGLKYVGSFACRSHATDPEHVKVNCADGARKVSFFAGP